MSSQDDTMIVSIHEGVQYAQPEYHLETSNEIEEKVYTGNLKNYTDKQWNEIIVYYEYVIEIYIRKLKLPLFEYEDLMQIGRIAIYKAVMAYRKGKGTTLTTYVAACVRNALISHLRQYNTNKGKTYKYSISLNKIRNAEYLFIGSKFIGSVHYSVEGEVMSKLIYLEAYRSVKESVDPIDIELFNKFNFGYTIQELSEHYDIPKKRLYVILARTRKKIKDKMNQMNNC